MKVIVDSCIWSLAIRRDHEDKDPVVQTLIYLIHDVRVQMIGPIRQELLSGIKAKSQFNRLRDYLHAFPDLPLESQDYEIAADFFNINRSKGIQGSNTDFLICALSFRYDLPIFTTDKDFENYKKHIPITLFVPSP